MARDIDNPERLHEEELELPEPLLTEADVHANREKSIERLRILWKQRGFLFRVVGVGLIGTIIIAFLIPNKYTSTTRLMPPDQQSSSGLAMLASLAGKPSGSLGELGSQLLGLKTTGDLFVGIIQSRTAKDDLIGKFNLRKVYGDKTWEDARKDLASRTDVSVDRKSEIITVEVIDRSPQRAADMAREYVSELNYVVTTLNTSSAHRERVFLEGRLAQVQQGLESSEKQFSQFASKNTTIDIQEQGKAMIEAGASLEGELIAAQTELEGLRQVFTDNNVRVRETQARVDELRRQLQKIGGKAGTDATTAGPDTATPGSDDEMLYPSIRQLPLLGVSYADLYRRMKVQEAVFETLTQQYELAKVEEAKETPSVKVLDPPNVPEKKSFPPRLLIVIVGTAFAGIFGAVWIRGRARWERIDSQDPGKTLAREILTEVRSHLPWTSQNGSAIGQNKRRVWNRLFGRGHTGEAGQPDLKNEPHSESIDLEGRHEPREGG